jgi:NADH:ubiquinone oxidoreductase subunit 3 (subunit A)
MPKTLRKGTVMDPFLILLLGLLAVAAIPGLVLVIADLLGPTETRHICRHQFENVEQPTREPTLTGRLS